SIAPVCSSYDFAYLFNFFFQAEDGIRDFHVTGVQTCALPIWEDIGGIPSGAASPVLGSILRTNWNDFSTTENFNIAPESNPLPVELLSFSAICNKSEVTLNWVTASEVNNSYFDVQQSTDGDNFTTIGKINGKGTTTSQTRYTFVAKAENIHNFFRLIQYDYAGSYKV